MVATLLVYWCQQSGSINICARTNCHLDACHYNDAYMNTHTTPHHCTSSSITNTTDCFINTYANDYTSTCTICTDPSSTHDTCFTPSPMLLPIMIKDKYHTHHTAPSTTNATICMLHCHLHPQLHHNKLWSDTTIHNNRFKIILENRWIAWFTKCVAISNLGSFENHLGVIWKNVFCTYCTLHTTLYSTTVPSGGSVCS